ncbi:MAG: thioredoxin [Burkholderiales bacterium]|nr:thioredoxin [Burkholderiales bacterium]
MSVEHATQADFGEKVLRSATPVLVDFWAAWCGPCRAVAPALDALALEQSGKLKVVKVNVDEERALASTFQIRSIPTLMLFKEGKAVDVAMGALPKPTLEQFVRPHLA